MTSRRISLEYDQLFREARSELASTGQVAAQFVTGSTTLFSGRAIPDLVFVPGVGDRTDVAHVVEVKLTNATGIPDTMIMSGIAQAKKLVAANPSIPVRVALAISTTPTERQRRLAEANEVTLLTGFHDGRELGELVAHWARIEPSRDVMAWLRDHGMQEPPGGKREDARLRLIGVMQAGPRILVDYRSDRGQTADVRHTHDGDMVVDVDATPTGIERDWQFEFQAAMSARGPGRGKLSL